MEQRTFTNELGPHFSDPRTQENYNALVREALAAGLKVSTRRSRYGDTLFFLVSPLGNELVSSRVPSVLIPAVKMWNHANIYFTRLAQERGR